MISRKSEVQKVYDNAEYTIDLNTVHALTDGLIDTIKLLESIVLEAIEMEPQKQPKTWIEYKNMNINKGIK